MPIWFSSLYWFLAFLYIGIAGSVEIAVGAVMKILPLLLLLAWFCGGKFGKSKKSSDSAVQQNSQDKSAGTVIVALGFSLIGDVILAVDGKNGFVFGLGAFLLSHIAYIVALSPFQRLTGPSLGFLLTGYAGFAAVVLWLMAANLGAMLLPVCVYIAVISFMSLSTWHSVRRNLWLIGGSLLFISSDATIGLSRFYAPISYSGEFIMLTYYAAQFCLLRGFRQQPLSAGA